jgi:DNA-binding NarL/FixJ family response regulator
MLSWGEEILRCHVQTEEVSRGVARAVEIRTEHPEVGVLLLSQVVEAQHALNLFSEHPHGFGYLLKDRVLAIDDFIQSVNRVAGGGTAIDPDVVSQLLGHGAGIATRSTSSPDASARFSA